MGQDRSGCDVKDIIYLRVVKTLESIILGLIIINIFLRARETGEQVTGAGGSCARTIVCMLCANWQRRVLLCNVAVHVEHHMLRAKILPSGIAA
jgi:hypothetical protein